MFCKEDLLVRRYEFDENKELVIEMDEMPPDPRADCNIGNMVCFHRRYDLGDPHENIEELICDIIDEDELEYFGFDPEYFSSWDEMEEFLFEEVGAVMVKPLYLMDHSILSMSTGSFGCPLDSGQIGFIFVTEKDIKEAWDEYPGDELLSRILESEVDLYDKYLRGDMYSYEVREYCKCEHCGHESYDIIDSCCGFHGTDWTENGLFDMAGVLHKNLVEVE